MNRNKIRRQIRTYQKWLNAIVEFRNARREQISVNEQYVWIITPANNRTGVIIQTHNGFFVFCSR
jgi:hypothetical protein